MSNQEIKKIDFDIIEDTIGSIGSWQLLMAFLISLIRVHISWHQLGIVFLAPEPKFQCSNKTITDPCSSDCPSYIYDRNVFSETIITEWDLVCDRKYYLNNVLQPLVMAGILVGSLVFGYISDRYGRKYPMIAAAVLEGATGVGAAYAPWIELFLVLKFISSLFIGGILLISFVITMEFIGKSYRTVIGVIFHFPYFTGYAGMGLIGYLIRDWRTFQMVISVTNFIFISFIWVIPESPRWLLLANRTEEAITILHSAAKFNKMPTYNIKEKVLAHEKQVIRNDKKGNYVDLVRTPEIRKRSICICFVTFVVFMAYFGVSQYLGQIGDSIFINVGISGILQIPANLICIFILKKIGRRNTLIFSNIMAGIFCLLIMAVPVDVELGITLLGALGIMFTGMSVTVSYIFTGELYPTIIRSIGMGTAAMCGKFGSTIVPFFLDLKEEQPWLPPTIMGILSVIAGLVCIALPETFNVNLPETIEDAENTSKDDGDKS